MDFFACDEGAAVATWPKKNKQKDADKTPSKAKVKSAMGTLDNPFKTAYDWIRLARGWSPAPTDTLERTPVQAELWYLL